MTDSEQANMPEVHDVVKIQAEDFDIPVIYQSLREISSGTGAIVLFTGLVREIIDQAGMDEDPEDNSNTNAFNGLEIEHYPGMAESQIHDIIVNARARWSLLGVYVAHRVGRLQSQDQIVTVAVSSAHRKEAFEAAAYIMDYLKADAVFWKKEIGAAGEAWVDAKQSDQDAKSSW